MRKLGTTNTEGFRADVWEDADGRCFFKGDLDVDADGANGQNGKQAAYMLGDKGSEFLHNGGMAMRNGKVVGIADWFVDIVFTKGGKPLVMSNGVVPSKTAYKFPTLDTWDTQLDSETVPYIVVPSWIVAKVKGIVKGCRARATYREKVIDCIVGDIGPRSKVGEGSIELCRQLGVKSSPRWGGLDTPDVFYEFWPGEFGVNPVPLLASNGTYSYPNDKNRIAGSDQTRSTSQDEHRSG